VRARGGPAWRYAAAAALLALSLGLAWLLADRAAPASAPQAGVAQGPRVDPHADRSTDPREAPPGRTTDEPPARVVVAAAPDRFELTSGPVRLVLFTDIPDLTREIPR
jgi:hypothetical protein